MLLLTVLPAFFISLLKILVTSGTQPPQPVPALVLHFTCAKSTTPDLTHSAMAPFVVAWHEHTTVSSSRSAPSSSSLFLAPRINSDGGTSSFFFFLTIETSLVKAPVSPIMMPPTRCAPSLVKTKLR